MTNSAKFSLGRVIFWICLGPVAWYFGLLSSVSFVSFLSLWALVETSWAAYRADRPTVKEPK